MMNDACGNSDVPINFPSNRIGDLNLSENEIRILLVDHDKEAIDSTTKLLALNYQVTTVSSASAAMKIIVDGKKQFDVVIADVNLPDIDGYKLCNEIKKLGCLVLLTSSKEGPQLVTKALESGAVFLIHKPADRFISQYVHQFVLKERYERKKRELNMNMSSTINHISDGISLNKIHCEGSGKQSRKYRKRKNSENKDGHDHPHERNPLEFVDSNSKQETSKENKDNKNMGIKWTDGLHQKFMGAIAQLGSGCCYPKEILNIMNVPGLTRAQVASHLQKCRKRRTPQEYKYHNKRSEISKVTQESKKKVRTRVFGSMPYQDNPTSEWEEHNAKTISAPYCATNSTENAIVFGTGNENIANLDVPTINAHGSSSQVNLTTEKIFENPIDDDALMLNVWEVIMPEFDL